MSAIAAYYYLVTGDADRVLQWIGCMVIEGLFWTAVSIVVIIWLTI